MSKLLWSVVIPSYNSAEFIEETLQSVLVQDLGIDVMEIVVVDNRSTDDTIAIIKRVGKERIKIVVNNTNVGMFGNFNRCIEVAQGEYIHMLNSDDLVKPGFYTRIQEAFANNEAVHLVCCKCENINRGEVVYTFPTIKTLIKPTNDIGELLYGNPIPTPSVVVRKKGYEVLGGFDTQFNYVADWEMWARVIYNLKGLYINEPLALYRTHLESGTAKLQATGANVLDYERLFAKFIKLGYPVSEAKCSGILKQMAIDYYRIYFYAGNAIGSANMISMLNRYASPVEVAFIMIKIKVRRMAGIVKKTLNLNR